MNLKLNKEYYLDIDAMTAFIFNNEDAVDNTNMEITEAYEADEVTKEMKLSNKVIREVKGDVGDNSRYTLKYDMVMNLINHLLTMETMMTEGDDFLLTPGEKIIITTLIRYGILKEVDA